MTDAKSILEDMIAIPSVNPAGRSDLSPDIVGEARMADYVEDFIRKLGVDLIVQKTGSNGERNVGGMLFRGKDRKTIILQSHMDTVGIGDNKNLLVPREDGGRIYGRGACDDKGSLSAMLSALAIAADKPAGEYNIAVVGVTDEEYSWHGSTTLVAQAPTAGAYFGIVGEPTGCKLVHGYKGLARWRIATTGVSAHSSQPEKGKNAIYRMAKVLNVLEEYGSELAGMVDDKLGAETVSVGVIRGGSAVNVVPDYCEIEIDRRLTRHTTPQQAKQFIDDYLKKHGITQNYTMSDFTDAQVAAVVDEDHAVVELLRRICRDQGLDDGLITVGFGSDAYRMNDAGIPTVVWGPGNIDVAHGDNEYVDLQEIEQATAFYSEVMSA
ncbi:M20 family metallopeptidase [bacterium]|nr:M20 family metallopeptidase [bacterium]